MWCDGASGTIPAMWAALPKTDWIVLGDPSRPLVVALGSGGKWTTFFFGKKNKIKSGVGKEDDREMRVLGFASWWLALSHTHDQDAVPPFFSFLGAALTGDTFDRARTAKPGGWHFSQVGIIE